MPDLNINMDIPNGHLLLALLFLFFMGGIVIGTLFGGYYVHNRWKEYDDSYKDMVEKMCQDIGENIDDVLLPIDRINITGDDTR